MKLEFVNLSLIKVPDKEFDPCNETSNGFNNCVVNFENSWNELKVMNWSDSWIVRLNCPDLLYELWWTVLKGFLYNELFWGVIPVITVLLELSWPVIGTVLLLSWYLILVKWTVLNNDSCLLTVLWDELCTCTCLTCNTTCIAGWTIPVVLTWPDTWTECSNLNCVLSCCSCLLFELSY